MLRYSSTRFRRNVSRIWPFSLIWLVSGWIFLYVEMEASGFQNMSPDSAITLTWPVFIFASIAVTLAGLVMGWIEMIWLQDVFRSYSLVRKIGHKLLVYVSFVFLLMLVSFPIAASLKLDVSLMDEIV